MQPFDCAKDCNSVSKMGSTYSLKDIQDRISEMRVVNTKKEIDELAKQAREIVSFLLEGGVVSTSDSDSHLQYIDYWAEQTFIDLGFSDSETCYKETA